MVVLKPLDAVLSVFAATGAQEPWSQVELARGLSIDTTAAFRAVQRALASGLLVAETQGHARRAFRAHRAALTEFLIHGARFAFVAALGRTGRGVPTAHAAPILRDRIKGGDGSPTVWPYAHGTVRGETLEPLHPCVPAAALRHRRFYDAMSLLDALRVGRARERTLAAEMLPQVLAGE